MKMIVEKGWFIPTLQFGPDDVFLFEDWEETPVGPYRAVFHFSPEDYRTLYVNNEEGRDLVSSIHRFDARHVVDISSRREHGKWTIEMDTGEKGPFKMEASYGATTILKVVNLLSPHLPQVITRNPLYCKLLPRIAAPIMKTDPNFKIIGATELGRIARFRMDLIYEVNKASCVWDGKDLGSLRDCCYKHNLGDNVPMTKSLASYLWLFVD
jgi:hypothetical protein